MKTYKAKDYKRIISVYEAVIKESQAKHDAKMQELAAQFMQQLDEGNAVSVSELAAKMRQCKREHAAYLRRSNFVLPYCKAIVRKLEAQNK